MNDGCSRQIEQIRKAASLEEVQAIARQYSAKAVEERASSSRKGERGSLMACVAFFKGNDGMNARGKPAFSCVVPRHGNNDVLQGLFDGVPIRNGDLK